MCILCVIQKWSRKIATMLPWLVIPLIGLWLLSQFLPPAFRFEITSPRLACVLVLLVTLFWYEILMPQLSSWRVRRNARLRERKRFEAIEMQKMRKTATRRCRNCLTAYREQNPGGGKFMCCYCGHVSKRPVLDLPLPPGLANGGILKDLVCGQDWLENGGSWVGGSFSGKSSFRGNGDENCLTEKSYSSFVVFLCRTLAAVFVSIVWIWRKVFRVGSSDEDASADGEMRGLVKKGENGMNCNESKSDKARRKAEEKRQARFEKEQLEEEERKQREEVARLVEERRKLRDEITEAEKDRCKVSLREKNNKREVEKKRQEKKKDKDRGSSKSNSDADELEKRQIKEIEKNKKFETDRREQQRGTTTHSNNIGSVGTRYLDRMRGSFLSSSRAFTGGGFFGKGTVANTSSTRELKSSVGSDHVQNTTPNRRDPSQSEPPVKSNVSTDDKNIIRPVLVEPQPSGPKKSWQQLFTRTSTVPSSASTNVINRPNGNSQKEVPSPISSHISVTQGFDNPITFGLPNALPNFTCGDPFINTGLQLSSNSVFPRVGEAPDKYLPEESDIFEDPCYVPDPVSLIGPVSESLGFVPDLTFQKPHPIKYMPDSSEVIKPSPIERHANSFFSTSTQTAQDMNSSTIEDQGKASERGWQIWDSLGSAGDPSSWLLPAEMTGPQPQRTMASLFKKDEQKTYSQYVPGTDDEPWMPMTYGSMTESDKHTTRNELVYGSPNGSAINHPFQLSQGNFWANNEKAVPVSFEGIGSASTTRPVGGLYSTPDVQSVWSYERREKGRI